LVIGCVPPVLSDAEALNDSDAPMKSKSDDDVTVTPWTVGVGADGVPPPPPHADNKKRDTTIEGRFCFMASRYGGGIDRGGQQTKAYGTQTDLALLLAGGSRRNYGV
jgi:hypothetical protein